jgi:acyl-CoA thioesterase
MDTAFERALDWRETAPGRFEGEFDTSWNQGRGAFGGLVTAVFVRAIERTLNDPSRTIRSLTSHLAAPALAGEAVLEVVVGRAGKNVSQVSAKLVQNGEIVASTLATVASRRDVDWSWVERPDWAAKPPDDVLELPELPGAPVFTQHYRYRFCVGAAPFSGADRPELGGWIRFAEPVPLDAAAIGAIIDVWPPAVASLATTPRVASTVDLSVHFLEPLPLPAELGQLVLYRGYSPWAKDGYAEEYGELYASDGRIVARTRQWVAIFG